MNEEVKAIVRHISSRFEVASTQELGEIATDIDDLEVMLEVAKKQVNEKILKALNFSGRTISEKGAIALAQGGWYFEARPWRTTFDPRKVEQGLRAKGIAPEAGMNTKITYEVDENKLHALHMEGKLKQTDLESWCYDFKLVVQRPKRVAGEGNDGEE